MSRRSVLAIAAGATVTGFAPEPAAARDVASDPVFAALERLREKERTFLDADNALMFKTDKPRYDAISAEQREAEFDFLEAPATTIEGVLAKLLPELECLEASYNAVDEEHEDRSYFLMQCIVEDLQRIADFMRGRSVVPSAAPGPLVNAAE